MLAGLAAAAGGAIAESAGAGCSHELLQGCVEGTILEPETRSRLRPEHSLTIVAAAAAAADCTLDDDGNDGTVAVAAMMQGEGADVAAVLKFLQRETLTETEER
mmetsp:Transcript_42667/g.98665  ORF Transcript_42667/g.98665 Transcript_42667/m.98665 type:complete len:104 (-) Transcript_42667:195-506(-)